MAKFPRITMQDFKDSANLLVKVSQDENYLNSNDCQYNTQFKEDIKTIVGVVVETLKKTLIETADQELDPLSPISVLQMAVKNLNIVMEDKDATSNTKLNAIKFLRDASDELKKLEVLNKEAIKLKAIEEFTKQFLTKLLDDKIQVDNKVLATQFLNRLKEIVEDAE